MYIDIWNPPLPRLKRHFKGKYSLTIGFNHSFHNPNWDVEVEFKTGELAATWEEFKRTVLALQKQCAEHAAEAFSLSRRA